ncbi:unnamed protein product [Paramecium pentaurelia]|uniref:Uncharacterized protein n=1 Tax=Paramecium pentaurelia TaxID=43138 RepID=A0A8S1XMU5_9CILI|nr:unnamed protein product [Paramecium pentaurelia]
MKSKLKGTKYGIFLLKLEKLLEIPPQRLRNILEIEKYKLEDWANSQVNQKNFQFKDKIKNDRLLNLVKSCQKLKVKQNNVTFYKHPMIQQRDLKDQSILKTLVVIGETGVEKSTMINFFNNYYIGVQHVDPFRFIIVDEEQIQQLYKKIGWQFCSKNN